MKAPASLGHSTYAASSGPTAAVAARIDDDGVRYRYSRHSRLYTREELQQEVEAEAAAERWVDGEFRFDEWLSDSVVSGHVKKVWPGDEWQLMSVP